MIALITARGNSQRLHRKNVLPFCGRPLITWSLIQASTSKQIDDVYVCTDDDEIDSISRKYGARVFYDPLWMRSADYALNNIVIYVMREIRKTQDVKTIVTLLPNNPLRKPGDIDRAIDVHLNTSPIKDKDGLNFTIGLTDEHHIGIREKVSSVISKFTLADQSRQQGNAMLDTMVVDIDDYIKTTEEIGSILKDNRIKTDTINARIDDVPHPQLKYFIVEKWQHFDIDYKRDFDMCEGLMEHMILKGRGAEVYYEYERRSK